MQSKAQAGMLNLYVENTEQEGWSAGPMRAWRLPLEGLWPACGTLAQRCAQSMTQQPSSSLLLSGMHVSPHTPHTPHYPRV